MAALLLANQATAGAQGVGQSEIVIGVTSAFTGSSSALGAELHRGYAAWFRKVNDAGGVHGRRIRLVLTDDGYDPPRAVKNTIRLIEQDRVFLLFGNVGTPTTVQVLPLLKRYEDRKVLMFSPFTGAQTHREEPYDRYVYNVRSSYRQETAALVDLLVDAGFRRIGVFYQSDSYGRSGQDGVVRALKGKGLTPSGEATYARGAGGAESMSRQVDILRRSGAEAVLSVGSYGACAAFIRDARDAGFEGPIANISFVGSEALLDLLKEFGASRGKNYTGKLVNSQVVPYHGRDDLPAANEYRDLVDLYRPELPEEIRDPAYRPPRYSFGAFEGYLNARVLTAALEAAGRDLTPESFVRAVESLNSLDIGLDVPVSFGPGRRQGLDRVYFTTVRGGQWAPLQPGSALFD